MTQKRMSSSLRRIGVGVVLGLIAGQVAATENDRVEHLSDAGADRIVYSAQDWGRLGMNTAVVPPRGSPAKLRIKDTEYEHGLGHHANGEIYVELAGRYQAFEAQVGVQWQDEGRGSVVFEVLVDGEKRFDSGVMCGSDPAKQVRVSVKGAHELRLVARNAGDGIEHDGADWADARLVRDQSATTANNVPTIDVAPFARLVTSDAKRVDGARAKRTEEYRAEDVFLNQELLPEADGTIVLPASVDKLACVGLEWPETRLLRRLGLEFVDAKDVPAPDRVQVQYWHGESAWQGQWKPLVGAIERVDNGLVVPVNFVANEDAKRGIQKVRWILPAGEGAVRLTRLSAHTASPMATVKLRVELERPIAVKQGAIEAYNGHILAPAGDRAPLRCTWSLAGPLQIEVHYCEPRPWKTDRTVLRFRLPDAAFGVAVEDVLNNDAVYVPHAGLFVTRDPAPVSLAEYKNRITSRKTVLQRVREMPDQTFEQAWAKVHNPIQDNGPMLVSLACDNRKFVAHRDGTVTFDLYGAPDQETRGINELPCELRAAFGSGMGQQITRHLHGGWLPVPVITLEDGGVTYQQRTWVAPFDDQPPPGAPDWLRQRALAVVEYTIENRTQSEVNAAISLTFRTDVKKDERPVLKRVDNGIVATAGDRLLAFVDSSQAVGLHLGEGQEAAPSKNKGVVGFSGKISAGSSMKLYVYLPAWALGASDYAQLAGGEKWLDRTRAYWEQLMAPAVQVELPDAFLNDVIRASQVHCLLAARNEENGKRVAAWISSDRYGPLESEAHSVIRGMDMMGQSDFARRSLDFFIHRYNPEGFLTTGYTIMGTGWHLWTLAEHYERTGDKEWLQRVAPEVARVCEWVARQCEKTKRPDARGEKMPEYGLVPPGVAADWNRYAYRFVQEAHFYAGLEQAARALADINHPQAEALSGQAGAFRKELVRAYRWTQAQSPVLALDNGTWVPAYPGMLYCFGRIEDIIPGEDGNRSWCYDVELGAHHLAVLGALDPDAPEVSWITDHMEDFWFLHTGMGDYPAEKSQADFFNLGGFAKVQPYYCRIAEIYALRDEVKPFVRSYFNTIPTLLSRENLSFWEHYHNIGGWNKTHETGYFLAQTRLMLVMERGDELWLAPLVTNNWLKDGMSIKVANAPTRFGSVSYTISSHVGRGFIEAVLQPPTRSTPRQLVLRLRHPDGKPIRSVTVNDKPHTDFDTTKECIRVAPMAGPIRIRAEYAPN